MAATHYVVLGGGMVGGFIARTLAQGERVAVTLADRDHAALKATAAAAPVAIRGADLREPGNVAKAVQDADVVVGALPGSLGFAALEAVIAAGKPCVDISFFPEDASGLDALARERGVPAAVDCGVMPGLGGMLAAHLAAKLDEPERLRVLVGGLPVERRWPLEYRAPFSPADVLEEYTRPARLKVDREIVTRPALSDVELVDFPGLGTLEAFNTDGLRSLLSTLPIPNMVEKTLRYPGHAERIAMLGALGFLSDEPVTVEEQQVIPRELTARLLAEACRLEPGMAEFTVMRVELAGKTGGVSRHYRCDMLDMTDPETGDTSMARTTGWPAVLAARALAEERLELLKDRAGVVFPEELGADGEAFSYMLDGLARAGVRLDFGDAD